MVSPHSSHTWSIALHAWHNFHKPSYCVCKAILYQISGRKRRKPSACLINNRNSATGKNVRVLITTETNWKSIASATHSQEVSSVGLAHALWQSVPRGHNSSSLPGDTWLSRLSNCEQREAKETSPNDSSDSRKASTFQVRSKSLRTSWNPDDLCKAASRETATERSSNPRLTGSMTTKQDLEGLLNFNPLWLRLWRETKLPEGTLSPVPALRPKESMSNSSEVLWSLLSRAVCAAFYLSESDSLTNSCSNKKKVTQRLTWIMLHFLHVQDLMLGQTDGSCQSNVIHRGNQCNYYHGFTIFHLWVKGVNTYYTVVAGNSFHEDMILFSISLEVCSVQKLPHSGKILHMRVWKGTQQSSLMDYFTLLKHYKRINPILDIK